MFPIIKKAINWFTLQINWLVSIWWGTLVANGLNFHFYHSLSYLSLHQASNISITFVSLILSFYNYIISKFATFTWKSQSFPGTSVIHSLLMKLTCVECSCFSWTLISFLSILDEWIFSLLYTWFGSRISFFPISPLLKLNGNYEDKKVLLKWKTRFLFKITHKISR